MSHNFHWLLTSWLLVALCVLALPSLLVGTASAASSDVNVADVGRGQTQTLAAYGDSSMSYSGVYCPSTLAYLPVIMNNAYGGWITGINIFNTSLNTANVSVKYYNNGGTLTNVQNNTIPARGSWGVSQASAGLANGFAGSAIVNADQDMCITVNQTSSTSAMSYEGQPSGGKIVNLPVITNNAYGGWTTGINIMNASSSYSTVTIAYYVSGGWFVGVQTNTLAPYAYWGVSNASSGLSNGFIGTAVVTTTQWAAVVVNETNSTTGGAISYRGVGAKTPGPVSLALPVILNNAYGGWTTGVNVMNTGTSNAQVTINYYNSSGASAGMQTNSIAPKGSWGISQASAGLPDGFIGSAVVTSNQPIVGVVNETKAAGSAMGYGALDLFVPTNFLPVVMNNAYGGWTTGINVMNVGLAPATVTIKYYGLNGVLIATQVNTVASHGTWGVNQASGSLASGQAGSAFLTATDQVAIVVNETK